MLATLGLEVTAIKTEEHPLSPPKIFACLILVILQVPTRWNYNSEHRGA